MVLHRMNLRFRFGAEQSGILPQRENKDEQRRLAAGLEFTAQVLRQAAVHVLHLIDKRQVRDWENLLTIKMKGVKTYSFFDTF